MVHDKRERIPEADIAQDFERQQAAFREALAKALITTKQYARPMNQQWRELYLLGKELDNPGLAACLSGQEQEQYQRVMHAYQGIVETREKQLSVLEWLVFLDDIATGPQIIGYGGHGEMMVGPDPVDKVKQGISFSKWRAFWKERPYMMASALELANAEASLYNILIRYPELYSPVELVRAENVQQKIVGEIAKTPDGLLLETFIQFQKNSDTARVWHHPSKSLFGVTVPDIELPEMDRSIDEVYGNILSKLFGDDFFPDCMSHVRQHCKDVAVVMPERKKRNESVHTLRVRKPFPTKLYIIEPVESETRPSSFTSIGIDRAIYDKYHGNKQ